MIEEEGKVVALSNGMVWVQTERQSTCGKCAAQQGCGQGLMAKMGRRSHSHIGVKSAFPLKIGDQVTLGIPENSLIRFSLLVYGLPLIFMGLFAIAVDVLLGLSEPWVILGSVLGLSVGFVLVKLHGVLTAGYETQQPSIVRVRAENGFTQAKGQAGVTLVKPKVTH